MIKTHEQTDRYRPDYAEVTIRCRNAESATEMDDIIKRAIQRSRAGDFYLATDIIPCYAQRRGYFGKEPELTERFAIHVRSHMCESDYTGRSVNHDTFYRIWSEEFVEFAKSMMSYAGCEEATVYLYGEGRNRIIQLTES